MGRRPSARDDVCTNGKPIARELKTERPAWLRPGNCEACDAGPLHGPHNGACVCAFVRGYHRLCRTCAIAYDYAVTGTTRIEGSPFTTGEWRDFICTYQRGLRAINTVGPM